MGLLMGAVKFKFWYRPLHFAPVDKVDSALASSARTPAYYYAKCYNMSRGTNRLTEQDWKFLYSILKDDKRCSNLIPAERSKFLQLAESKIGEKKRIKDKQEEPTTAEVKGVAVGEAEVVTVTEDGIQTDATTHPESDK